MDVESRKAFHYGFILREADLRRLVDTITDQFRKLVESSAPSNRFKLKFRNGVVADNLSVDDVLNQENSGPGQILRLAYTCDVDATNLAAAHVALEFINADEDDEPGYVSIRFHVFGHDRDWVFVTSSLIEERIERLRRWAANQLGAGHRRNPFTRVAFALIPFLLGILFLTGVGALSTSGYTTRKEVTIRKLTADWKAGKLKDPVAVILAIQSAEVQDLNGLPWQAVPWRLIGFILGGMLLLTAFSKFLVRYYLVYNFCWGEYLDWFNKREAARKFWLTVIAAGFLISFLASILANRIKW